MDSAYYLFPFLSCPFTSYNFIQSVATFMFFYSKKGHSVVSDNTEIA